MDLATLRPLVERRAALNVRGPDELAEHRRLTAAIEAQHARRRRELGGGVERLDRAGALQVVVAIGARFVAAGLQEHARLARALYAGLRDGTPVEVDRKTGVAWDLAFAVRHARALRVSPFERDLEDRPRGSTCPCEGRMVNGAQGVQDTRTIGGTLCRCMVCGWEWREG